MYCSIIFIASPKGRGSIHRRLTPTIYVHFVAVNRLLIEGGVYVKENRGYVACKFHGNIRGGIC